MPKTALNDNTLLYKLLNRASVATPRADDHEIEKLMHTAPPEYIEPGPDACHYCGCTEPLVSENTGWPYCPQCKAV
jgi:hypothetical protein